MLIRILISCLMKLKKSFVATFLWSLQIRQTPATLGGVSTMDKAKIGSCQLSSCQHLSKSFIWNFKKSLKLYIYFGIYKSKQKKTFILLLTERDFPFFYCSIAKPNQPESDISEDIDALLEELLEDKDTYSPQSKVNSRM